MPQPDGDRPAPDRVAAAARGVARRAVRLVQLPSPVDLAAESDLGDRRALAETRDGVDQRLDLVVVEDGLLADRLLARRAQRHPARSQVEVGAGRAGTDEARSERAPLAPGTVARRAVLQVEGRSQVRDLVRDERGITGRLAAGTAGCRDGD